MRSMVDVSHDFLKPVLHRDAVMIDATLGTGRDSAFFLKKARRVIAFEIQPETAARCRQAMEDPRLEIRVENHTGIRELDPALEADGVIFNFGWDPAGDHQTVTQPQDSLSGPGCAGAPAGQRPHVSGVLSPCGWAPGSGPDPGLAENAGSPAVSLRKSGTGQQRPQSVLRAD